MKGSFVWLLFVLGLGGCSKRYDKPLAVPPFANNSTPGSAGSIRLINFGQLTHSNGLPIVAPAALDLAVNDRRLTTFTDLSGFTGSTLWFPTGKFGYSSSLTIPDSLYDADGNATLQFYYVWSKAGRPADGGFNNVNLDSVVLQKRMAVHNDISHPQDIIFYDAWDRASAGIVPITQLASVTVPRSGSPSAQPDHFKIRLINLTGKPYADTLNQLTLTYADGSKVDVRTTAVTYPGASDYIDLPYGTYQFKIKDQKGNALGVAGDIYGSGNRLLTFLPGGVYTLIAYNSTLQPDASGPVYYNPSFVLLTDIAPSKQPNYIRVQAIHAAPGLSNLHFSMDGQPLGGFLAFGQHTGYNIFSIGPHKLQLTDGDGKELASKVLSDTYPLDNLSVWAYIVDGRPELLVTANDLSLSTIYNDPTPGAIPGLITYTFGLPWKVRFLNLSIGVPYASFIDNTGNFASASTSPINSSSAWEHLSVGTVLNDQGLVTGTTVDLSLPAKTISAYDSPPGAEPGTSLNLSLDHPLVADSYPNGKLPATETGLYTIALIGNKTANGDTLRMITVKHNQ